MKRLLVVGGTFSYLNAVTARPIGKNDDVYVLVLFTYDPAEDAILKATFTEIQPYADIRFLHEPADYKDKLSDEKYLTSFCGDVDEVRMFFTHNTWLHNRLFSVFPGADIVLFEEGLASYYPGLLDRYEARDRIVGVYTHSYRSRFVPPDASRFANTYAPIDPTLFLERLGRLRDEPDPDRVPDLDGDCIVITEQYLFKKGDAVTIGSLALDYAKAVRTVIAAGYRAVYKRHPRERTDLVDAIRSELGDDADLLEVLPQSHELLEQMMLTDRPAAVAGISSTSLLTAPHFFDVPSFRIESDAPLAVARAIGVERRGLMSNHVALAARIPSLDDLAPIGEADRLNTIFWERFGGCAATHLDAPLVALGAVEVGHEYVDLVQQIMSNDVELVSFDLFDTLVKRPALDGSDVFSLLDRRFRDEMVPHLRLSDVRRTIFPRLRGSDARRGVERTEYLLRDVYTFIGEQLGLDPTTVERMEAAEVEIEQRLVQPRAAGIGLLSACHAAGTPWIITTDTYFDQRQLEQVAIAKLPVHPDRIFLSSTEQATKAEGDLFDVVVERCGVEPSRVLHVGDRLHGDVEPARDRGLQAALFPASASRFRQSSGFGDVWNGVRMERGNALVTGLIASEVFDNPWRVVEQHARAGGDAFLVGYTTIGPALLFWSKWVLEQADRFGFDRLLFMSRDGYLPLEICRRLAALRDHDAPEMTYTYGSRATFMSVFSASPAHVAYTEFVHGLSPENTPANVLRTRFGDKVLEQFGPTFRGAGFDDLDEPIGRRRIDDFKLALADLAPQIAELGRRRRSAAIDYYRQEVGDNTRPAVVDVGYSGSSQRGISFATDRDVAGLYLTTMEHTTERAHITDAISLEWANDPTFFQNGGFLEYLITPQELQECTGFRRRGDRVVPVFGSRQPFDTVRAEMHRGVGQFLDDAFGTFGAELWQLAVRPRIAHHALSMLIGSPTDADIDLFRGRQHEDAIGSNRGDALRYWQAAIDNRQNQR